MAKLTPELLERESEVSANIEKYCKLFDLDANLVRALITQESRFTATAKSPTGAYGYGQFTNIAAKQVQNISAMTDAAKDLANFTKQEADKSDRGIKAICATLWWLFHRKYADVSNKRLKIEACLTFYNAGGKVANLVLKHGSHAAALPDIKKMPANERSQGDVYAPEILVWYVVWHEHVSTKVTEPIVTPVVVGPKTEDKLDVRYQALLQALKLLADTDENIDLQINSRDGMTEFTLILPGEYFNVSKED